MVTAQVRSRGLTDGVRAFAVGLVRQSTHARTSNALTPSAWPLAEALHGVKGVEVAFVFGSLAGGAGKAGSDVDLMVIGEAGLRALAPRLRAASTRLGREINPVTMTAAEFAKGQKKNPFLAGVLTKEKLFVKGDADELGEGAGCLRP